MKITRTLYSNENDLRIALENASKASPDLYIYGVSLPFQGAYVLMMKRLNKQAPTDAIILSNGQTYWKNGKEKQFTDKQIIADEQVGWNI